MRKEEKPFAIYENPDMEADERTKPKEPIKPPPKGSSMIPQPKISSSKPARKAGSFPKTNLKSATKLQSKPKTASNISARAKPRGPDVYDNVEADDEGKSEINRKSAENISKLDEPKDEESHGVKNADKTEKPNDQKQSSQKSNEAKEKKPCGKETPDALLQPKRFEKGEKEKIIAKGVAASRHAYKTMDDVDSDWGSPKGDAGVLLF
uniref:Uncharacterized protein n=1 Tax=Parascaris univalens TaxID=6257 RepID=A0A915BS01_PARUN